jgi:hypothetical protein
MSVARSTHPEFCHYTFSDNRRCRMLRQTNHPTLCPFHARDEQQLLESHTLGAQIATAYTGDYLTAADINHVLSKVFTALAQNRIPQRNAVTMAYLRQIMLQTLPLVKKEHPFSYSYEGWTNLIENATHLSAPEPSRPQIRPKPPRANENKCRTTTNRRRQKPFPLYGRSTSLP